jgi:hypothetical protein
MSYKIEDWDQTKFLPSQCISIPDVDLLRALKEAYSNVLKSNPSFNSLCVLFAQITLESGVNAKYMHNFNPGNIKSTPTDGRLWTAFRCSEVFGGKEQFFDPPNPICNFRAFKTCAEGMTDYVQFLSQNKNYAKAWSEVINGNPEAYAQALHDEHYYTASVILYTKGVVSICNQLKIKYGSVDLSTHIDPPNSSPIDLTPEDVAQIQGQLGLSMDKSIQEYFTSSRTPDDDSNNYDEDSATIPLAPPKTVWNSIKGIFGSK